MLGSIWIENFLLEIHISECITLHTHSERLSRDDRPSRPHLRSDRPALAARPDPSPPVRTNTSVIKWCKADGERWLCCSRTLGGVAPGKGFLSWSRHSRPSGTLQWHSAGHYHSLTDQHPAVFLKDLLAFYPNHTYSLTNISERRAKCPYATHLHVSYIVCRHSSSSSLTITWPHSAERLSTSSLFHQSKRQPTASPSYVNIPRVTASPLPFKLV